MLLPYDQRVLHFLVNQHEDLEVEIELETLVGLQRDQEPALQVLAVDLLEESQESVHLVLRHPNLLGVAQRDPHLEELRFVLFPEVLRVLHVDVLVVELLLELDRLEVHLELDSLEQTLSLAVLQREDVLQLVLVLLLQVELEETALLLDLSLHSLGDLREEVPVVDVEHLSEELVELRLLRRHLALVHFIY